MTSTNFSTSLRVCQISRKFLRQIVTVLCSTALVGSVFLLPLMPAYADPNAPNKQEQRISPQDEYRQMGRGDWIAQPFDALPSNNPDLDAGAIARHHFAAGRLKEAVEALESECRQIAKNWNSVVDKKLYDGNYHLPIRALVNEKQPCLQRLTGHLVSGENSVPIRLGEASGVIPPYVATAGRGTRGSAVDSRFRWHDNDGDGADRSKLASIEGFGDPASVPAGEDGASYALRLARLLSRLAEVELASGQPDDLDLTNRHLLASRAWLARAAGVTSSPSKPIGQLPNEINSATVIKSNEQKVDEGGKPYDPKKCSAPEEFLQNKNANPIAKSDNINYLIVRNTYTHALLYLTSTDWGNAIATLAELSESTKNAGQSEQTKLISIMADISLARARMLVGEQPNLITRDLCLYTDKSGNAASALGSAARKLETLRASMATSSSLGWRRQIEMLHMSSIATGLSWAEMMMQSTQQLQQKNAVIAAVEAVFKELQPQFEWLRSADASDAVSPERLRRESLISGYQAHQKFIQARLRGGDLAAIAATDLRVARSSAEKLGDLFLQARWNWLHGRIQRQIGQYKEAQDVLERAISQLDAMRADLLRAGTGPGESFRETLAPMYRELIAVFMDQLLPKNSPDGFVDQPSVPDNERPNWRKLPDLMSCARLEKTTAERIGCTNDRRRALLGNIFYYMEKLKAAELEDYFKDDCVSRVRSNENRIDDIIFHESDDVLRKRLNNEYQNVGLIDNNHDVHPAYIVYPVFLPDRVVTIVTYYVEGEGSQSHELKRGLRHALIEVRDTPYELEKLIRQQNFILSRAIGDKTRRRGGRGGELFPTVPGMMDWRRSDALPEFNLGTLTLTAASSSQRSAVSSPSSATDTAQDPDNSVYNARITNEDAKKYFKNNAHIYQVFVKPVLKMVADAKGSDATGSLPILIFAPDGILYTLLLPGLGDTRISDTTVPAIEDVYQEGTDTLIRKAALTIIPGRTLAYFDKPKSAGNEGADAPTQQPLRVLTAAQRLFNVISTDPTLHAKSRTELRANVADACMMTCALPEKTQRVEFKDGDFCPARFLETLSRQNFDIIHIGAHARIAASSSRNLIETDLPPPARYRDDLTKGWDARVAARHHVRWADGNLTLGDLGSALQGLRMRPTPLQMLVLSACDTAAGDARAALGLAGMAVQAGARSALGTLLSVNDDITYGVMHQFYQNLLWHGDNGRLPMSRTMALRQAQIVCISNKSCFDGEKITAPGLLPDDRKLLKDLHGKIWNLTEQARKLFGSTGGHHKALLEDLTDWAPFVLIGDWRPISNAGFKWPQSLAPISGLNSDAVARPITSTGQASCLKQCLKDYNDTMTPGTNEGKEDKSEARQGPPGKYDFRFCQVLGKDIAESDADSTVKYVRSKLYDP